MCPLLYKSVSHTPLKHLLSQGIETPLTVTLTVLLTVLLTVYLIKRVRARDKKTEKFEVLVLSKMTSH